jgi:hypothetical protein
VLDGSNDCRQGLYYGDMFYVQIVVGGDLTAIGDVDAIVYLKFVFHWLGLFCLFVVFPSLVLLNNLCLRTHSPSFCTSSQEINMVT